MNKTMEIFDESIDEIEERPAGFRLENRRSKSSITCLADNVNKIRILFYGFYGTHTEPSLRKPYGPGIKSVVFWDEKKFYGM